MTEIVIHSGAFKTATSAVQTLLFTQASRLLREQRVLIPKSLSRPLQGVDDEGARSHNRLGHLVRAFRRGESDAEKALRENLGKLVREIEEHEVDRVIVSTEMLTRIDSLSAQVIAEMLSDFDLRVVYSVRRVDDYLESYARQQLKFKDTFERLDPEDETPFSGLLAWAETLGEQAVTVLVYGHPNRESAVTDTLQAMGVREPEQLVGDNPVRNPSLDANGLMVRRALSRLCTATGRNPADPDVREAIIRMSYAFSGVSGHRRPLNVYSRSERLEVFDATRRAHEEIARRFLDGAQAHAFLDRAAIERMSDTTAPNWSEDEILAMVDVLGEFAVEHLPSVVGPDEAELVRVRRNFRVARRRNQELRQRVQELEARSGGTQGDAV